MMETISETSSCLEYDPVHEESADLDLNDRNRTPTLQSPKFARISSGKSIGDKLNNLSVLFSDQFLITEFPGKNSQAKDVEVKDVISDDESDIESIIENDGRTTKQDEYETDLDMDYDEWVNREKHELEADKIGDKKYLHMCNETGVIPVNYFLQHIQDREFVMRFHGIGPLGAKALATPLQTENKFVVKRLDCERNLKDYCFEETLTNQCIETINLEGNSIGSDGCTYLAKVLKQNIYVTELTLADNEIGNEGAEAVANMLHKNDILITVDLSANGIDDIGAEKLCIALRKNSTVKHLFLAKNDFEERGAYWFKDVLNHNESLETLDLSWNHFRTRGAIAIGEGLQENYGLKKLNISMNGFFYDGAEALGKALKNNRTLTELDISHNRIPEIGAEAIANGLLSNDTLKILRMGSNMLGNDGPMAILNAIKKNDMSSLEVVDLENVVVVNEFVELQRELELSRAMVITHGGTVSCLIDVNPLKYDPRAEFTRDPMTILQAYAKSAGYRMLDLFKEFDTDGNFIIDKDEFEKGIQKAKLQISVHQMEVLMKRLDKDKNGKIDYGELLQTDEEHKQKLREQGIKLDTKTTFTRLQKQKTKTNLINNT